MPPSDETKAKNRARECARRAVKSKARMVEATKGRRSFRAEYIPQDQLHFFMLGDRVSRASINGWVANGFLQVTATDVTGRNYRRVR